MKLCANLCAVALALLFLAPSSAPAENYMYITDHLWVTVRTGPSLENKVIGRLGSGDKVSILEKTEEGWAKIVFGSDKEGWLLFRYLQEGVPAAIRIKELGPQATGLLQKVEELTQTNQKLEKELDSTRKELTDLRATHEKLKTESAEFLKLKQDYGKLKADTSSQTQKVEQLSTELESLRFSSQLKWFLAGAGVLLVGYLMGLALARRKRRWSSSL